MTGPTDASADRPADAGAGTAGEGPREASVYIGVAATSQADARHVRLAEALGRHLAEAGAVVVCGGGGGAMEAVCRGATSAGGMTVGLLPGARREEGNEHLGVALPTGLGEGRNVLLVRASDALVAVGGGYGTLSEIALALRIGVPVVGLATWSLALGGAPVEPFPRVEDPAEAARLAVAAAGARRSG
jgi:uncharacterized protein (TIGR00725 family)